MAVGFFNVLSALFGWVYTFCWSLSFYPQPLLNFSRKSTSGTTVDFPLINCLGVYLTLLPENLFEGKAANLPLRVPVLPDLQPRLLLQPRCA